MFAAVTTRQDNTAKSTSSEGDDLRTSWKQYRKRPSAALRNKLMERYFPVVRYNAERISTRLPDQVEMDDLLSAGMFGLKDAIDAFDPDRGVKFETFCTMRVRGAILDELRSMDWVPRLVRTRSQRYRAAAASLESELARRPSEDEIAERMDVSREEFEKYRTDATATAMLPLTTKPADFDADDDDRVSEVLEDRRSRNPVNEAHKRDVLEVISRGLTRAERLILVLYYYEELTMKEIGATLDLSESRVSQMHSSMLKRLKSQLQQRRSDLVA